MVRDAEVARLVAALREDLRLVPDRAQTLLDLGRAGISPGEACGMTAREYEALFRIASDLYEGGDLHNALPVALQLVLHSGRNVRFATLAGDCLKGLGRPGEALAMFALAVKLDSSSVEALFRLAECLQAEKRTEEAIETFFVVIERASGTAEHVKFRELACAQLAALRAGMR